MYRHLKAELIINGVIVLSLILVKIFLFLPTQTELEFNIAGFVAASILTIPTARIVMHYSMKWSRYALSSQWIELEQSIYALLGIPITIACIVYAIYVLGQPASITFLSILCVALPVIAFSRFINTMEES